MTDTDGHPDRRQPGFAGLLRRMMWEDYNNREPDPTYDRIEGAVATLTRRIDTLYVPEETNP